MCEVNTRYLAIHSWLLSNEAASDIDVSDLDTWLGWWHFRYRQWGGYMQLVSAYVLFAHCFAGVCAYEFDYVDVHAHGFTEVLIVPNYTTSSNSNKP